MSAYAHVCVDGMGDPLRATQALARAAELAPDSRVVSTTSRWLAEQGADPALVLTRTRAELAIVPEGPERAALLWQIAAMEEHVIGDVESAKRTIKELCALTPNDLGAWDVVGGLHLRAKAGPSDSEGWDRDAADDVVYGGVVESLESIAQISTDPILNGALHAAVGALRDRYLNDESGALASVRRALECDEANAAAQGTLEAILLRRRSWDDYAHAIVALAERTQDPKTARELFERAGDVYGECVADHPRAAHCFVRAATLAETDPTPVEKLAGVLERAGRWEDATAAYERLLTRVHDPTQKAWTLVRLGNLKEARLNQPDDAFAAYRLAVDVMPTYGPAVQALLRVARGRKLTQLVIELERREADRVADNYARSVRYAALAEMIEAQHRSESDGRFRGDAEAAAEATALYERALALDPRSPSAFDALDRIFRESRQWPRLIALYESVLKTAEDPRRARALRVELAELHHSRAGNPTRAAELLREALSGPEDRFDALVALGRALDASGKWSELVQVLEAQASMLTGNEEIAAVHRIGMVLETRVKDLRRALSTYEIVLDRAPRHEAAARAILRIHEMEGRHEHVIAAERKLLELMTRSEDVVDGLLRIARVYEDNLGRVDEAIATYMEALDRAPSFGPTLTALDRLLRSKGDYRRLAQVLQRFADASTDRHTRVRAMIRAASILELCMDDGDSASAAYGRALASAGPPGDIDRDHALWGLMRLQETREEWERVDASLHAILETTTDPTSRMRALVRRARNAELRMGDVARAAALYEEALTTPGSGSTPVTFSVDRLRVARLSGSTQSIANAINAMAQSTSDSDARAGLLRVLALLREHTTQHEAAAKLYDRLVERDREDLQALDGLIRCVPGGPAPTILARARATKDPSLRALYAFAAGILDDAGGRAPEAESAYSFALSEEPELLPILDAARRLRAQRGDWAGFAQLSERAAKASIDPDNVAKAWLDAADAFENRLGESIRAIAAYESLLKDQPGHAKALERALFLLESTHDWSTAATLLRAHAEAATDSAVRVRCYTQRAAVLAGRLGDVEGAIIDLRRALSESAEPDLVTLQALAVLEERAKHWQEALELHDQIARLPALDGTARRRARLAAARIYGDELRDDTRARDLLEDLSREAPEDRDTLTRLAEVSARSGHEARAFEIYNQLSQLGGAAERARVYVALADLVRARPDLWPASDAETAMAHAFDLAIADPSAIAPIEERFAREGDFRPFMTQAEAAINRVPPNAIGILHMRTALAKILRERLGNPDAADRHLAAAIKAFPDSMPTRLALAAALRGRNDEAALAELRRAVESDPTHPGPFEALVTLTIATGRPEMGVMLASAASLLGGRSDEIEITLADNTPLRPLPDSLLVEEAMNRLVGPSRCWFLRSVINILDPFLPKLFPGAEQVVDQRGRLPDTYPVVAEARAIAAALGVPAPVICRGAGREAALLLTEPRAILLGSDALAEGSRAVALFHVAYILARVAASGSLYTLPRQQIGSLLDAATLPDTDGPLIRDFRKRISSVLPRAKKKELERVVATAGKADIRAELTIWEAEESRRALYAGVVMCRDVRAVAEILADGALGAASPNVDDRRRALTTNPALREVLEFVASSNCWELFRRVYGRGV